MCVVSMVMDHFEDEWFKKLRPAAPAPFVFPGAPVPAEPALTADELRQLRDLIARAKQYDIAHNQPDCELDAKKEKLRRIVEVLDPSLLPLLEEALAAKPRTG
jgi:hypothetical protein